MFILTNFRCFYSSIFSWVIQFFHFLKWERLFSFCFIASLSIGIQLFVDLFLLVFSMFTQCWIYIPFSFELVGLTAIWFFFRITFFWYSFEYLLSSFWVLYSSGSLGVHFYPILVNRAAFWYRSLWPGGCWTHWVSWFIPSNYPLT